MKIGEDVQLELKQQNVQLPANYSATNAVKSAWLTLQSVVDKNNHPALDVCTKESVTNAVLNMIIQGLNPMKRQCSFVVYGVKLVMQREYAGEVALAKRVDTKIKAIRAQAIYEGDIIKQKLVNGMRHIEHEQDFMSAHKNKIIGAYAIAVDEDERQIYTDIMTIDEIKQSWKKSKTHPVSESGAIKIDSTHGQYPEEMTKKTVYRRLCKLIINSSDDEQLLKSAKETDAEIEESEIVNEEVSANANRKLIDFDRAVQQTKDRHPDFTDEEAGNATIGATLKEKMATDGQCKQIFDIEKKSNRETVVITTLSDFVGREITGLKQLSFKEAAEYIEIASKQNKSTGPSF